MSSYNNVTKIKYTGNLSDLVSLNEYIVFQDDKAKRKYIVFKFTNNVTQQLLGMEFEVCQYNAENNLIEKSVVIYNKFLAGAEEEFVPKAKLRVSYHCTTISVRLIKAAYDRFVWNEGEYEDNCYKFDHFFHDENSTEEEEDDGKKRKRRAKRDDGEHAEKPQKHRRKQKQKKSKHPFVMKDATRRNISRFPAFFNVVACIAVIAFVMASVLIFKNDTKKFTQGDYQYRIINEATKTNAGEIAVCGYVGTDTVLTVPSKWGEYNVIKVDNGAFINSNLTVITFRSSVLIDTGAFVNCKNLTEIKMENVITIEFKEGAFNGCTSLNKNGIPDYALVNCD